MQKIIIHNNHTRLRVAMVNAVRHTKGPIYIYIACICSYNSTYNITVNIAGNDPKQLLLSISNLF